MAYIFKFKDTDKIINLVKTNPRVSFFFYSGSAYYNNKYNVSGAFSSSILGAPDGYVSLYEQDIDRTGSVNFSRGNTLGALGPAPDTPRDPFGYAVNKGTSPTIFYINEPSDITQQFGLNPHTTTFKVKDGTRVNFKTVSKNEFNLEQYGNTLFRNYPLTASIQKHYYSSGSLKVSSSYGNSSTESTGSISFLYALKNTLNYYSKISLNYQVSSSARNLTASAPDDSGALDVGLLTIPSIFYGDSIEKGSVNLKFYITGTLIGELKDARRNGDLIQVGPPGSTGSGSVAGVALYNEGFVLLTGSWDLSDGTNTDDFGTNNNFPTWVNFAQTISASAPVAPSSSFSLDFTGSHKIPTMTLFAHAQKGALNHSNNPTYPSKNTQILLSSGSVGYIQNPEAIIKNVVSSSYPDPTGSFVKTTYISKIGIYDKNKNLIGIAKVATPVKKVPSRDFTFKIKIDI